MPCTFAVFQEASEMFHMGAPISLSRAEKHRKFEIKVCSKTSRKRTTYFFSVKHETFNLCSFSSSPSMRKEIQ
jgi:hypothetical protein